MESSEFAGKVAVVTGAARGIGRAIALHLARLGADVTVADINLAGARDYDESPDGRTTADEIRALGRRSLAFEGDLAQTEAAEALFVESLRELGAADILVNCAGGAVTPFETSRAAEAPPAEMAKVFGANYDSMVHCCRAAVRQMRERKRGAIVNIASVAGFMPPRDGALAHYGAAKAAMLNYSRSLAGEVGPDGIRVNAVAPGVVLTARIRAQANARGIGTADQGAAAALRRLAEPEDIAKVVQFFASDLAAYVTGQCLAVDGGMALAPC